jgi:type IX secretion system PorP/SprF family membrane protein
MKKTFTFFTAFACLLCTKGFAQDFTFSQFYEKPLLRNPALAGVFDGDIRVSVAHRNQWGSVTVPFQTSAVSIENKLPFGGSEDFLTLAVQMTTDAAGDIRLKRTQLLPTVNYHKSLSSDRDSYLSLAFMGGISNSQFDPTQMKLADQWQNGGYSAGNATMQKIERTVIHTLMPLPA